MYSPFGGLCAYSFYSYPLYSYTHPPSQNCVPWNHFPKNKIKNKQEGKNLRKNKVKCTSSIIKINDTAKENTSNHKIPREFKEDCVIRSFWMKRFSLFHRFHEGIKLDRESWFSVTPESVAAHIANKCSGDVVVDAFCGAGGNTIQFAKSGRKVIAIDIDPVKIELAKHNARVYGVEEKIEFIVGDFFELAATVTADVIFLSPPWGGPNYNRKQNYDIETMLQPRPASELMQVAQTVSSNVIMYLPRTSISNQLINIAKNHCCSVEMQHCYLNNKFIAITAYYCKNS